MAKKPATCEHCEAVLRTILEGRDPGQTVQLIYSLLMPKPEHAPVVEGSEAA